MSIYKLGVSMNIKTIKLKKSEYANLPALLKRVGLVRDNEAYPSNLFVSKPTYKRIKSAITAQFKKEYPHTRQERLKVSVGMTLLNLGPVVVDKGIELGYAVVVPLSEE